MAGRVCLVTGANSGIGRAASAKLAKTGVTVVMVARDEAKGREALAGVKSESGNQSVELLVADLNSMGSVRKLAETFRESHASLHVLLNNAGVILGARSVGPDGVESNFAVNYLSHFLLTNLLMDTLKASAPSRVVNVTSDAHFSGHIDFDNLQLQKGYGAMKAYSQAKLAQVLFTRELARRLEGTRVTANCVHPGVVRTHWGNTAGGLLALGVKIGRPFFKSPERGAEGPVFLAISPDVDGVSGKYFSGTKEAKSSKESYDDVEARRLWQVSCELTGIKPDA